MAFSKNFPSQKTQGAYTTWVEVKLTEKQERECEHNARNAHVEEFQKCIDDAKEVLLKNGMKVFDPNIIQVANALFEKRASHTVYYKEERAKDVFDQQIN